MVLGATLLFCVAATLIFSLGPALKSVRTDVAHDLKQQTGEPAVAGRWNRFFSGRHCLVMAQIALSLVLLFSGGLFLRGALNAVRPQPGFHHRRRGRGGDGLHPDPHRWHRRAAEDAGRPRPGPGASRRPRARRWPRCCPTAISTPPPHHGRRDRAGSRPQGAAARIRRTLRRHHARLLHGDGRAPAAGPDLHRDRGREPRRAAGRHHRRAHGRIAFPERESRWAGASATPRRQPTARRPKWRSSASSRASGTKSARRSPTPPALCAPGPSQPPRASSARPPRYGDPRPVARRRSPRCATTCARLDPTCRCCAWSRSPT